MKLFQCQDVIDGIKAQQKLFLAGNIPESRSVWELLASCECESFFSGCPSELLHLAEKFVGRHFENLALSVDTLNISQKLCFRSTF